MPEDEAVGLDITQRKGGHVSAVTIDPSGVLVINGQKVFPICLSDPPPLGGTAPSGKPALQEVADAGVSLIRTGIPSWSLAQLDDQIASQRTHLDAAAAHGLRCWMRLAGVANLPASSGGAESVNAQLLARIVDAFRAHPGLGVWKGVDEPANPLAGPNVVAPAGLVRAYNALKTADPEHPLVITQAPRGPVSSLVGYRPAFDITGVDIYPISYPPGIHSDSTNHDVSVVGEMTVKMVAAAGGKPVWTTLQIAWTGVAPSQAHPLVVPRFPSLRQERYMAYQSIVSGARGLVFFGGHMIEVTSPSDAAAGWNWTFWQQVLRSVVAELASPDLQPALVAPAGATSVHATSPASGPHVELIARQAGGFLYVIAVERSGSGTTAQVPFAGLPRRHDGSALTFGEVLFEDTQQPPPLPLRPNAQAPRRVAVANNGFRDWFGAHDVHVYRFAL